jgi:ribosomal protein S18 acetylase RimI-like enzyme
MLDIRVADPSDAETVAGIVRESFARQAQLLQLTLATGPTYVAFETAAGVKQRMDSGSHVVLAFRDGEPIGTVSAVLRDDDHGEIMRLAVLPQHRGNGYGKQLMGYAERYLLAEGAAVLEVAIVAQFNKLERYYEGLGYSKRDQRSVASLPFEVLFLAKRPTDRPRW